MKSNLFLLLLLHAVLTLGFAQSHATSTCTHCKGKGIIIIKCPLRSFDCEPSVETCNFCNGTGNVPEAAPRTSTEVKTTTNPCLCKRCNGTGTIYKMIPKIGEGVEMECPKCLGDGNTCN